jgi:hypothetical protein
MAASTGGIQFNGDTAAANALDDYEEGTWTPTIAGGTVAGTASYTTQLGRYTKIGNRVLFNIYINYSSFTGTGSPLVSLPFAIAATIGSASCTAYTNNYAYTASTVMHGIIIQGASTIRLDLNPVGGGGASIAAIDAAAEVTLSGQYISA